VDLVSHQKQQGQGPEEGVEWCWEFSELVAIFVVKTSMTTSSILFWRPGETPTNSFCQPKAIPPKPSRPGPTQNIFRYPVLVVTGPAKGGKPAFSEMRGFNASPLTSFSSRVRGQMR
jgi:hypothetical protein